MKRKSGEVKERYGKALLQVLEGGVIHERRVLRDVIVTCGEPRSLLSHHILPELLLFYLPCLCTPPPSLPFLSSVSVLNRNTIFCCWVVVVVVVVQIHQSLLETMARNQREKSLLITPGASISAFHPREASSSSSSSSSSSPATPATA